MVPSIATLLFCQKCMVGDVIINVFIHYLFKNFRESRENADWSIAGWVGR